jgi:chorismate dehydratase
MKPVALGAVGYLNARPLVFGLERHPRFTLRFDVPSRCAELLHTNAIDLGLIPSIEYLRAPDGASAGRYRIVPDLAITSHGAVASVMLYTTKAIGDLRSIALDTSSRTSVALTRVLCSRAFGIEPAFEPHGPDLQSMLRRCDAALVIGDNALLIDAAQVGVTAIDLGDVWTRMTGLPFVYAFWAGRPGLVGSGEVRALVEARDAGLGGIDAIAREYFPDRPDQQAVGARYLRDNIQYHFGPEEQAGLALFYRYAAEAGVVKSAGDLEFF